MKAQTIEFNSNDTLLSGVLHTPKQFESKTPLFFVLTGDGPKGTQSATWQPIINTLAECNVASFIFDFHSQGLSEGNRKELTLSLATKNLHDAYESIVKEIDLNNRVVGAVGSSFGGSVVLNSPKFLKQINCLVLKSPASCLYEAYENELDSFEDVALWKDSNLNPETGLSYYAYLDALNCNLYENIHLLTYPTLIVHGGSDTLVPTLQSQRLALSIGNNAILKILPNVNHGYKEPGASEALNNEVKNFINHNIERL